MNKLSFPKRKRVLHLLVEGCSLRSTARLAGVSVNAVIKLMLDAGKVAHAYHGYKVRGIATDRVQCDEVWSFLYAKQKNVPAAIAAPDEAGHTWTWTAIDPDTKLMIAWRVGDRGVEDANLFMTDVADRLTGRVQLTTDGWEAYEEAVAGAFLRRVDYAQLVKAFTAHDSPGIYQQVMTGDPDLLHVSTSIVERSNLTIRMGQRRYTRLTYAFSRKLVNHCASLALYLLHYNFIRPHSSLANPYPRTPAMAAGLVSGIRDLDWAVGLIDSAALLPKRPKRYKKLAA